MDTDELAYVLVNGLQDGYASEKPEIVDNVKNLIEKHDDLLLSQKNQEIADLVEVLKMYADEMFYFPRSLIMLAHEKNVRLAPCYSEFGEAATGVLVKYNHIVPDKD